MNSNNHNINRFKNKHMPYAGFLAEMTASAASANMTAKASAATEMAASATG
jgi:hypothetical protein